MRTLLLCLAAGPTLSGCTSKSSSRHNLELLTGAPWKYAKAGFDSNQDGVFDALDPRIAGCEKDNMIIFKEDGTGLLEEGKVKCKVADPDSLPFLWSFQNGDSTIYFQDQYYKVQELTNDRLAIYEIGRAHV